MNEHHEVWGKREFQWEPVPNKKAIVIVYIAVYKNKLHVHIYLIPLN